MFVCQEAVVQPSCEMGAAHMLRRNGLDLDAVSSDLTDTSVNEV